MSIYRKDQKRFLNHLIPKNISEVPKKYDFIIASQCFKLRSPLVKIVKNIIQPLLSLLNLKGQMFLIYSSGKDFTKSFLKYYYPNIRFYNNFFTLIFFNCSILEIITKEGLQSLIIYS